MAGSHGGGQGTEQSLSVRQQCSQGGRESVAGGGNPHTGHSTTYIYLFFYEKHFYIIILCDNAMFKHNYACMLLDPILIT